MTRASGVTPKTIPSAGGSSSRQEGKSASAFAAGSYVRGSLAGLPAFLSWVAASVETAFGRLVILPVLAILPLILLAEAGGF